MSIPASINNEPVRTITCSHCNLKKLCLPKGLTQTETKQLEGAVEYKKTFEPGEYLYEQGAPLQFLYIVRSGSAKSLVTATDGAEQIIGFHLPGDLLGLDALEHRCHTSSAIALNTTSVCALNYERFDQLCTSIPHLHVEVMMEAAKSLTDDHELLLVMGKKKAEERVAIFLLDVSARMKAHGFSGTEFNLCMPRSDLANYLGVAPATLSRIFTGFEHEGMLQVDRRHVRITSLPRLHASIKRCEHCDAVLID